MSEPNGITQNTLYDRASRISYLYTNKTGSGNLETINYTYDAASIQTYTKDIAGSETTTTAMAYDLQHRLGTTSVQDSVRGNSVTTDTYDAVGNLVKEAGPITQTYTYDRDNELIKMSTSTRFLIYYWYDQNGNQIAFNTSTGDSATLAYDYENRLIDYQGCSYTYTPTGDRASDSCIGAPNERYDAASPASASDLVAQYDTTGTRQDRYVSAGTDHPVEMIAGSSTYWYTTDGLGSVNRLTDGSGNTADTYAYDVWGNTASQSGSVSNPFQFTARTLDS